MEINGTSYEVPNIPRALELERIFEGLDETAQDTYGPRVAQIIENGANYESMSARERADYRGELQRLIDEISAAVSSPAHSPAVSRASTQEIIDILERRGDASRPHIRDAIRRLEAIDLSDTSGLEDTQRERISEELGELLRLIESDSDETRREQIADAVSEVKDLYDRYIIDRREITERAAAETADENFELMVERAREISLEGRIDSTDWNEVLPRITSEFTAMGIEISTEDYEKLENFINAIRRASEGATVGLHSIDGVLEEILTQAEQADRTGPVEITINEANSGILAIIQGMSGLDEDPMVMLRNFFHEMMPERVDAGASGEEFSITFDSREQAVEFVTGVKSELSELQEFDAIDTIADFAFEALVWTVGTAGSMVWAIDGLILDGILADFNISTSAGIATILPSTILHVWAVFAIRNKLRIANSGVSPEVVDNLANQLRETIRIYEDAGFSEDEIRNMRSLLDNITLNLPETPEGIDDLRFRARYIYTQLQRWRGNAVMDEVRFGASVIGRGLDQDWGIRPTRWVEGTGSGHYTGNFAQTPVLRETFGTLNGIWGLGWVTRNIERYTGAHLWLGALGSRLINRGPNGWRVMYTKSETISDYQVELERSNAQFRQLFQIIDGITEFPTSERERLKRQILELYGGGDFSRLDPLRRYNFELSLLGGVERQNLFTELETTLRREGTAMRIESIMDFHRGLQQLPEGRRGYYMRLLRSFVTAPRIRRRIESQAADILQNAIRERLGYIPENLQETLTQIRQNSRRFEAQREAVANSRTELLRFIEFYPGLSDADEARLMQISHSESLTSANPERFRESMLNIFQSEFGLDIDTRGINDFLRVVETQSMRMGENRNNARVRQEVESILRFQRDAGNISEAQFTERSQIARDFFQGSKTFWQPHLGLIVEDIISGRMTDGTHTVAEVQNFLDRGGDTDIFNYLDHLRRELPSEEITPSNDGREEAPDERTPAPEVEPETPRNSLITSDGRFGRHTETRFSIVRNLFIVEGIEFDATLLSDLEGRIRANEIRTTNDLDTSIREFLRNAGIDDSSIDRFNSEMLGSIERRARQIGAHDIFDRMLLSLHIAGRSAEAGELRDDRRIIIGDLQNELGERPYSDISSYSFNDTEIEIRNWEFIETRRNFIDGNIGDILAGTNRILRDFSIPQRMSFGESLRLSLSRARR